MRTDGFSKFKGFLDHHGTICTWQYGDVMSFSGQYLRDHQPGHFTGKAEVVSCSKNRKLVGKQVAVTAELLEGGDILKISYLLKGGKQHASEYFARAPPPPGPPPEEKAAAAVRELFWSSLPNSRGARQHMTREEWEALAEPLAMVGITAQRILEFREGRRCSFWFVSAEKLRSFEGTTPPSLQGLRREHPEWLEQRTVSFAEGCAGEYVGKVLVVSHRWEHPSAPDGGGTQFAAVKEQLLADASIQWVWYDFWSMPQGAARSKCEDIEFRTMLPNVNLLYLFCSVLILLDGSYMSRFWTQLEAFLSLRKVTAAGLDSAPEAERRCFIRCIHNADPEFDTPKLLKMWANKTAEEAHAVLKRPDVVVTNQSDKTVQLSKLEALDAFTRRTFEEEQDGPAPA